MWLKTWNLIFMKPFTEHIFKKNLEQRL